MRGGTASMAASVLKEVRSATAGGKSTSTTATIARTRRHVCRGEERLKPNPPCQNETSATMYRTAKMSGTIIRATRITDAAEASPRFPMW